MSRETSKSSLETAWILLTQEGVSILPKRNLRIPAVNQIKVLRSVGLARLLPVNEALGVLTAYLRAQPIADRFGSDHLKRREWKDEISRNIGTQLFKALYDNRNQFRLSYMNSVCLSMTRLRSMINENNTTTTQALDGILEQTGKVFDGYDPVTGKYDGKMYNQKDTNGKLQVIQYMEDRCIEVLSLFGK